MGSGEKEGGAKMSAVTSCDDCTHTPSRHVPLTTDGLFLCLDCPGGTQAHMLRGDWRNRGSRFIANLEEYELPRRPHGRYHRFVIDVDMERVHEYVMMGAGAQPWPVVFVDEMINKVTEFAAREETMRLMARRSD